MSKESKYIRKLKVTKTLLENRYLSYILIPAILFTSGCTVGKIASSSILEYKTIIRTIDGESGREKLSSITYDEHPTEQVVTVLECGPWQQVSDNNYSREVVAYDIGLEKVLNKDYRINLTDIEENQVKKYQYIENRNSIPDGENMEDSTIKIQETRQDKNVSKKSQKYVLPISIAGIVVGAIIDSIIKNEGLLDRRSIEIYIDEIERKIKRAEIENQTITKSM